LIAIPAKPYALPEPCLDCKCRTPLACREFGYCRARTRGRLNITNADVERWRSEAGERRRKQQ
jgi:hypothetical protein